MEFSLDLQSGSALIKRRTTRRARYADEQIIGILTELDADAKRADLYRKHSMSEGTFYIWKVKFGGLTVSEAKRLSTDAMLDDLCCKISRD